MFRTLTPTLAIVAALIIGFLFVRPEFAVLTETQQEIANYEKATEDYAAFQNKIEALEATRNNVSVLERDRLDALVPREIDITQRLVDLEALAKKNFLLFGNISIADEAIRSEETLDFERDAGMMATPEFSEISFDVIGTYDQFKGFLRDVEKSLPLYEITRIQLSKAESGPFMQFAFTVRTYALPPLTP